MPRIFQRDSARLLTNSWQAPLGPVKVDWSRAPRGLRTFFLNTQEQFRDVASDALVSFNGTPRIGMTRGGPAFDPTLGVNPASYVPGSQPAQCSVEAYIYYGGGTTYGLCRISEGTPSSTTADRILEIDASGRPVFYIFDAGQKLVTGTALSVGLHHLVGTAKAGGLFLYVDGVQAASDLSAGTGGYTGFSTPVFNQGYGFSNSGGVAATPQNQILHSAFADTAWTASEVAARYFDMYGFLIPAEGEMPALFVAGGGGFTPVFRKTLSPLGTRIGARQGWAA